MKTLYFLTFFFFCGFISANATDYYVATTGDNSNAGTLSSPFRTLQHAINLAAPGDVIYLRGGVYAETTGVSIARGNNGTAAALKQIFAYEGETPVLNFSAQAVATNNRGFTINGNYWHVKGVIVENAGDNGIFIGGNNNIVEKCITRGNNDSGLQLGRYSSTALVSEWPSFNLIVDCESYDNKDINNEDADGFACKLTTGAGNIFRRCVAHHNIDDGWDLYTKPDTGPIGAVTLEDCIAHNNGILTNGITSGNGDKNGFKLGGEDIAVNHIVRRCVAFNNGKHGFTYNRNLGSIEITNCTGYKNAQRNFSFDAGTHVYRNNLSYLPASNDKVIGDATAPNAFSNDQVSGFTVNAADFVSLVPGSNANLLASGFLHLAAGSDLIDAGIITPGISYGGTVPDLGAVEYGGTITPPANSYTLAITASPSLGGSVTKSPDKSTYSAGEVVTLTATPASGYNFTSWSGGGSGTSVTTTVTINANTAVTANFTAVATGGTGTLRIDNTATAATGLCSFEGTFRLVGSVNVINLSNTAGKGITWKVKVPSAGSYDLKWRYAGGGSTAQETARLLINGVAVNQAVPFPKPASSTSFLITAPQTVQLGSGVNEIRIEAILSVALGDIEWIEITGNNPQSTDCVNPIGSGGGNGNTYTLTTSVTGQGTVNPSNGTYNEGQILSLTATPATGWQFSSWTGDATGSQNPLNVVMTQNKNIAAVFTEQLASGTTLRLEEAATPSAGYCSINGDFESENEGADNGGYLNTLNAIGSGINWKVQVPAAGTYWLKWRFANLSGDRTAKIMVNGLQQVAAVPFAETGAWSSWVVSSTVPVQLAAGVNTIRLEALTINGLSNIDWMEIIGNNPVAALCNTGDPVTSYQLTTSISGQGSVNPASGTFNAGEIVTVTATPATGWQFIGWSGGASGTTNPLSLTMNSNKALTAIFSDGALPPVQNTMTGYATVSGEGYATTTGGEGGACITISSLAELEAWALLRENNTTPQIVYINGKFTASSSTVVTIKHGANVSVLGIGSTAELQNIGLNFRDYKNVIVRNLKIHEVFYPNDALTIDECQHVWVDHCEFFSKIGAGIGVDTYDGLLDIKNGSRYVTVSWNHFHDHMKDILIGHTDNAAAETIDRQIRVSFHHNYFENTDGRNPSLRWGAVHFYNNYLKNITDYGFALRQGAHGLIQNNVYENVRIPITTNKFDGEGFACESGNLFTGTSGANSITQTGCDWWNAVTLPYNYTLDPVSSITTIVPANVGIGRINISGCGDTLPPTASYILTVTASPLLGGSVTKSPDKSAYNAGEVVTLTATPASGYNFTSWSGGASGTSVTTTVTISANTLVTANFTAPPTGGTGTLRIDNTATPTTGLCSYDGTFRLVGAVNVINLSNTAGKGINWKVEVPAAGTYSLTWRYAGGGSTAQETARLLVNGVAVNQAIPFPKPASSTSFLTTAPVNINLGNGVNEIRIEAIQSLALADIEWIEITGTSPHVTNCANAIGSGGGVIPDYTLTTNVSGQGTISRSPDAGIYPQGTNVTLTASAAPGYTFAGWSGDVSGSQNPLSITIDGNKNITASFTQITYDLAVGVSGQGTVDNTGGVYVTGTSISINATPSPGWKFDGWSGSVSSNANPLTLTINSNHSIIANFSRIIYIVTTSVSGNGSVSDGGTYFDGDQVSLTATPAIGWKFDGWSGTVSGNSNPLNLTINSDQSITANFSRITYIVTTSVSGNGSVSGSGTYFEGDQLSLTATPAAGWRFTGWSGDATGSVNPLTVIVNANKNITAIFTPITHQLTTTVTGQGSVTPGGTFNERSSVVLTATPFTGWKFTSWAGDASGSTNPLNVIMDRDKNITAIFTYTGIIQSVNVYPVPFHGSATFEFTLTAKSKVKISLYTLWGMKVADVPTSNGTYQVGTHRVVYNNPTLMPGQYVYIIVSDNGTYNGHMIAE
jgi:uncharacterized repeat protein (TIGR02543 family)